MNYKDGDFPIGYFGEERPTGQGKELVAILDNGVEVIFDDLGGSGALEIRRTNLRCPGVSDQCELNTELNTELSS